MTRSPHTPPPAASPHPLPMGEGIQRKSQCKSKIETFILTRMRIRKFEPRFMKVGVLTAALQELTPRKVRARDPDGAIEEWLAFARELEVDNIHLSAALHPSEADIPPEAMLDPVANTLDLRKPFDKMRTKRVEAALKS